MGMQADLVVAGELLGGDGLTRPAGDGSPRRASRQTSSRGQAGAILGRCLREHQIPGLQRIEVAVDPLVQVGAAAPAAGWKWASARRAVPRLQHRHIEVDLRPHWRSRLLAVACPPTCWLSWRARLRKISRRRQHRLASPHLQQGQPQASAAAWRLHD